MASKPLYQHAAVIGVGLIGGSVALALRERGLAARVVGVTRSTASAERALACGVVEEATADFEEGCSGADLVVVCTPVGSIVDAALAVARHAAPGALVTDGGSTKEAILAAVEAAWPQGGAPPVFVGSHPLAGDHRTGPEAARGDLFDGATTVVTPTDQTPNTETERAIALWESLGSTVVTMSPERHDRLVAVSSHLPHVAAAALAAATSDDALRLAATGWADTTRVAAGSPSLWREILLANRVPVAGALRELATELTNYAAALDEGDGEAIERWLEQGKRRRDALGS